MFASRVALSFDLPYPSRRAPALGRQAVAASHALAAQAGHTVLQRGGNAIDAAIAAAAVQTVVEPTMNGVGGDVFALVWDGAELHGLNASGRAPRAWSRERFAGRPHMPELGWDAVTVPGAVSGCAALRQPALHVAAGARDRLRARRLPGFCASGGAVGRGARPLPGLRGVRAR